MKSVRIIGAALALSGIFAVPAVAQQGGYSPSYQTSRFAQPAVLPDTSYQKYGTVQQTTGYALTARRTPEGENVVTPTPAAGAQATDSNPSPIMTTPEQVQPGTILSGGNGSSCGCNGSGYGSMHDAAMYGGCGGGDCGSNGGSDWTAYFGGLYMGRTRANKTWTTYETNNNPNQLMYYPDADWGGGAEIRVGKYIGCDHCTMLEGVYYGIFNMDGFDSRYSAANLLSTPFDSGFVNYVAPGSPASAFMDNAREHRVWRNDEFHNAEINVIQYLCGCGQTSCCQPLSIAAVTGFRFMQFNDNLLFGASSSGFDFGTNPAQEAYFTSDVSNSLYGFQIGALINRQVGCNWSFFARPMVGVFGNHMEMSAYGYRGDGATATFPSTGHNFDLSNSKDDIAIMGQLDLGVTYKAGCHWSLTGGYRVIGITGVALADDQVPAFLAAENDWTDIDSHGALILHGVFAGATYSW